MKRAQWVILAALLAAPLGLTGVYLHEFWVVDSALDTGASYDYRTGQADYEHNHPYIPFSERHGKWFAMSAWSLLGAGGYGLVMILKTLSSRASS